MDFSVILQLFKYSPHLPPDQQASFHTHVMEVYNKVYDLEKESAANRVLKHELAMRNARQLLEAFAQTYRAHHKKHGCGEVDQLRTTTGALTHAGSCDYDCKKAKESEFDEVLHRVLGKRNKDTSKPEMEELFARAEQVFGKFCSPVHAFTHFEPGTIWLPSNLSTSEARLLVLMARQQRDSVRFFSSTGEEVPAVAMVGNFTPPSSRASSKESLETDENFGFEEDTH